MGGKENGNWKQGLLQHLSTVKTFHSVAQWMAQALGILHFKKKEVRSVECEPLLGSGHLLNCYHHPKIHMGSFIVLCEFSEFLLLEQQRGRPWKPWNSGKDLTKAPGEKGTAGQYIVIANRVSIVDTCSFILWPLIIDLNRCHYEKKMECCSWHQPPAFVAPSFPSCVRWKRFPSHRFPWLRTFWPLSSALLNSALRGGVGRVFLQRIS